MRAIGFNAGLRGDLVMATVAARSFKEQYPDDNLTLAVGPAFKDMLPLFFEHPFFDDHHVWSTYDGWPKESDLNYLRRANYDIVFHPFPPHRDNWWEHRHQYAEAANMVGLPIPTDINPVLTKWFEAPRHEKTIAFAPFAGWYNPQNDKRLTVERAQEIVNLLRAKGYRVVQMGGPDEPALDGTYQTKTDYFQSVKDVLGCDLLIHTDTGLGHVCGAYQHPAIGLYSHRYYGPDKVRHIQPISPNTKCLDAANVNDISLDQIDQALSQILS